MSKKNIIQFIGEKLNDSLLIEKGESVKLGKNIISNAAPKRTSTPLTRLTTKNTLASILEISKKTKVKSKPTKVAAKKKTAKKKKRN